MVKVTPVQQLQQDLSQKNMLFSKDLIELTKVIGQGKMSRLLYGLDTEGSVLITQVSCGAG